MVRELRRLHVRSRMTILFSDRNHPETKSSNSESIRGLSYFTSSDLTFIHRRKMRGY